MDGCVVGRPAWTVDTTLHFSVQEAQRVADCFSAGVLQTGEIGEQPGRAARAEAVWADGLICASQYIFCCISTQILI